MRQLTYNTAGVPDKQGKPWSDAELVLALRLYYDLLPNEHDKANPKVIALSEFIGRTRASVAMRLGNYLAVDPDFKLSGHVGLVNGGKRCEQVFTEYYGQPVKLDERAKLYASELSSAIETSSTDIGLSTFFGPTEYWRIIRQRRGQQVFREVVLGNFNNCCALTGIDHPKMIRASHIIPWSRNAQRRVDVTNGIALNAWHDCLFDAGYITFDADLRLQVSTTASKAVDRPLFQDAVLCYEGRPLAIPKNAPLDLEALRYHREEIFNQKQ